PRRAPFHFGGGGVVGWARARATRLTSPSAQRSAVPSILVAKGKAVGTVLRVSVERFECAVRAPLPTLRCQQQGQRQEEATYENRKTVLSRRGGDRRRRFAGCAGAARRAGRDRQRRHRWRRHRRERPRGGGVGDRGDA